MSGVSTDGSILLGKYLFGIDPVPEFYYLAVVLGMPDSDLDASQLLEPDDGTYSRVQLPTGSGDWAVDNTNAVTNISAIEFGESAVVWGNIAGFVLCTAATDGDIICWGEFEVSTFIGAGVPLIIPEGSISFGFVSPN
jgi:hypothetical protein